MVALKALIMREARYLGGGILDVSSFINHQIDPAMMNAVGIQLARGGYHTELIPTKVLTAAVSGIAPAFVTAQTLSVPMVYARKKVPVGWDGRGIITQVAESRTHLDTTNLCILDNMLGEDDVVLIVDDFLATGSTAHALAAIVKTSGADLAAFAFIIDKKFESKGCLDHFGVPVRSCVSIAGFTNKGVVFEGG
jgi:xanthine phosphoribosyltransferase